MKLSSILLAAAFLGVVFPLGARWLEPLEHLFPGCRRTVRTFLLDGGDRVTLITEGTARPESPERARLEARLAQTGIKIRETESALRKIESSEASLKRRLHAQGRRGRTARSLPGDAKVVRAHRGSEAALLEHLEALAREKLAFQEFLDDLKNEEASLKVEIDLFDVASKRSRMEQSLFGEAGGPVDDLNRELRQRSRREALSGSIAY